MRGTPILGKNFFGLAFTLFILATTTACSPAGMVLSAGTTAGIAVAQERPIGEAFSDKGINLAINRQLLSADFNGLFRAVSVHVVEGRVLLTGHVDTEDLRAQAVKIAWQTDGVRTVINELHVGAGDLAIYGRDSWITAQLRGKFLGDAEIADINYTVATDRGIVYLLGIARDETELKRALAHARDVANVRRVVNHIIFRDDPNRPD